MKTHILIENNSNNNSHGSINVTREWKTLTTTTIANKTPKWRQKLPICLTKWLAINVHTQSSGWQPVCRRARKGQREQLIDKSAERERESVVHSLMRSLLIALAFESLAVVIVVAAAHCICNCRWGRWACLFCQQFSLINDSFAFDIVNKLH